MKYLWEIIQNNMVFPLPKKSKTFKYEWFLNTPNSYV